MTLILKGCLTIAVALLGLSYLGAVHPVGDSLAVFRAPLGVLVLICGIGTWRWTWAGKIAIGLACTSLALWAAPRLARPAAGTDFVVYQKNLLYRRANRRAFVEDVISADPDVVTLQELSRANLPLVEMLSEALPYNQVCEAHVVGAVAVLSKWPITDGWCSDTAGIAMAEVRHDAGVVRVASIHVGWPWPYPQHGHLSNLLPEFAGWSDDAPVVVGGDFNMVPEGHALRRVARATGADRVGHVERTFAFRGYPMTIDHVFATGGEGAVDVRGRLGSDHFGVLARIAFPQRLISAP